MDPFTPTKILTHSIFEDIILWIQYGIDSISQKVSNTVDPTSPTLTTSFNIFHTSLFKFILIIIVLILCAGIIYVLIRMRELKHADAKKYKEYFIRPSPTAQTNKRWQNVEALFQSSNPNDWRVAIIEADTMLDDLITLPDRCIFTIDFICRFLVSHKWDSTGLMMLQGMNRGDFWAPNKIIS